MKPQVVLTTLFLFALSCDTTDPSILPAPTPYTPTIELSLVDAGLTDAHLRVRFLDSSLVRSFLLSRNGQSILDISIVGQDTIVVDNTLQLNTVYEFKALRTREGLIIDSSAIVQVTTLDTTSHDYTFHTFYLGEGASSIVNDVAIINDTLIYAVGEISFMDSTGGWQNPPFNVAKWNGAGWEYTTAIDDGFLYGEVYSLFAFSESNLWGGGTVPMHWDGQSWLFYGSSSGYVGGFRIRGIWGVSSQDLYVVGDDGNIRHFDGTTWSRVESGTALHIRDIFGGRNPMTGEVEIYAVAAERFVSSNHKVLRIQGQQVTAVTDSGILASLDGIWFQPGQRYYVVGDGMYMKQNVISNEGWQAVQSGAIYYLSDVNGSGLNDVFACGSAGEFVHFNGLNWKNFRDRPGISGAEFRTCNAQGQLVVAGGFVNPRGYVVIGRRNQ